MNESKLNFPGAQRLHKATQSLPPSIIAKLISQVQPQADAIKTTHKAGVKAAKAAAKAKVEAIISESVNPTALGLLLASTLCRPISEARKQNQ